MPSIISSIGYILEANTTGTSTETIITRGVVACNRPEQHGPLLINFVSFNSDEFQAIDSECVYLIHGNFVYNKTKSNGKQHGELQVNNIGFSLNYIYYIETNLLTQILKF